MQMQRRPMEVRDILQTGFRLLTDHWMPLLLVNAVAAIPGLMITVATSVPDGQLPDGGMLMFGMLSAILVYPLSTGANIKLISDIYRGHSPDLMAAIEHAAGRFARILWVGFVMGLFIGAGFLLFVLPGLYFGLRFIFANHAAVLTDAPGASSLSKSGDLMAGHYVRIATLLVVCITLMMVFGYGTAMGLSALGVLEAGSMTEPAGPGFDLAVGIANIIPSAFLSVCVTMAFLNRMDLDAAPEPMASSVPAVPTWAETASNQPETPLVVPPEPLPLPDTEVPEAPEVPPEDQGDPEDEKN